jgi:hypothetical protein
MSIPAFAWALEQGAALGLRTSDRLVLIYLADQANGAKVCWPGQPLIERYTGLKNNTVRAAINRLTVMQLIRAEMTPGKVTRYHILRADTPANGTGVTPANEHRVTPANGTGVPPQTGTGYPLNCGGGPPQNSALTPANGTGDPFRPKKEDPKRRASAPEAGKILSFPEKEEAATQPVAFGSYLDQLRARRAQPLVVGQDVVRGEPVADDDNPPVDPGVALAVLDELKRSLRMKAYPPRAAAMSPDEQAEALCPRRPQANYLPDAVLRVARAELAARAAARGVVP